MKQYARIPLEPVGETLAGKPGVVLQPGQSLRFAVTIPDPKYPVRRQLRVVGEVDVFWLTRCEAGMPARAYRSIADALDPEQARGERYSLLLQGDGEAWPRNAFVKLGPSLLRHLGEAAASPLHFGLWAKAAELRLHDGGELCAELGIYRAKKGRHPEDVFDPPDELVRLDPPEGSYDWRQLSREVLLPSDASCLLVRVGGRSFSGRAWLGSPVLAAAGGDTLIPPFEPERPHWPELNWLGENLSRTEWPELELAVDRVVAWSGRVFNSIYRSPDFSLPLPELEAGAHELELKLLDGRPAPLPFRLLRAELQEESARSAEIVAFPAYVPEGKDFSVLVERNEGGRRELDVILVQSGEARPAPLYTLEGCTPLRVVRRPEDGITLSTGDAIYIAQSVDAFSAYLSWYLENEVGNSMCFRPAYRWSGSREVNPELWRWLVPLLGRLGLRYHLMVDGRELPGKNANPPDELLQGPGYLGRQNHENDGAFCYWGAHREDALFGDIFARSKDPGGIFPSWRPALREGPSVIQFYDPREVRNMKQGAHALVEHLRASRAASTRHTGPSTLFRYFFQAGYDWLGAEQMYGPEEVILSALRGASRAYGKTEYGAHLAVQWSSIPHDSEAHARRYFLSLATCYLHGATNINTEEGLWRMESEWAPHDRFSRACEIHRREHRRFYRFLQTHPRRGELRVSAAVLQGNLCGWRCFGRGGTWGSQRPELAFGPPEESFDLLSVFYPRTVLDAIYRNPCPDEPQGWYSGTPYGPVDLVPIEAPLALLRGYDTLAFLGWNTYREPDGRKLLRFVEQGGTLILGRRHLSTSFERGAAAEVPDSPSVRALVGSARGSSRSPRGRAVGAGTVVYFPTDEYPSDRGVRAAWEARLREAARDSVRKERDRGWLEGSRDVGFAAYDWDDGETRTLYLLDIDWWSGAPAHTARLLLGARSFPVEARAGRIESITVRELIGVMPLGEDADVIDVSPRSDRVLLTLQSDAGTEVEVFLARGKGSRKRLIVDGGGVREIAVEL